MTMQKKFELWASAMAAAWMNRDVDQAVALFSDDVVYYEDPFSPPVRTKYEVRSLWSEVPTKQKDIIVCVDLIAIVGVIGIAHWNAKYTDIATCQSIEMDGVYKISLNQHGICNEFRQWWNERK